MAAAAATPPDLAQRAITALQEYLASLSPFRTHRKAVTKVLCGETTLEALMTEAKRKPGALCNAIDAIATTEPALVALSAAVTTLLQAAKDARDGKQTWRDTPISDTGLTRLYYCCALEKGIEGLGESVKTLSKRIADNILEYRKSGSKRLDLLSTIIADTKSFYAAVSSYPAYTPEKLTLKEPILTILNRISFMPKITQPTGVYATAVALGGADAGGGSGPAAPADDK